jgi:multimeric flavodoxin WrbA
MKILAINGSPRKKWNTATMIEHALRGAASKGAETELVHLYDLNFKGCTSCFACKMLDGKSLGKCGYKDELTPILQKVEEVGALILGAPIYFGIETGELRSFMERLLFQYLQYAIPPKMLFNKKIKTGFIYTMNVPEEMTKNIGYEDHFKSNQQVMSMVFGHSEYIASYETLQFEDFSKVESSMFDIPQRIKRHEEIFPLDCAKAYEMGAKFAEPNQQA